MAAGSGAIPHPAVSFYTCPINILVNFVPRKRFKSHLIGLLRRFVSQKRFTWYKVRTIALLLS